jgi:hypothetical protein
LPPPHSPALRSGDAVSPEAKAKKLKGLPLSSFKKHPLPVNGYDSGMLAQERFFTKKKESMIE